MVTPEFVLAGHAVFTVSHDSVGRHFTLRVLLGDESVKYRNRRHFLYRLAGPNNSPISRDWRYVGMLVLPAHEGQDPQLKLTKASKERENNESYKVAAWALRAIWQVARGTYILPTGFTIAHAGLCGRCGRQLTTPASIAAGFGSGCARVLGIPHGDHGLDQGGPSPSLLDQLNSATEDHHLY